MLTLTAPQKTIFHKISAGQKLLALCVVSTALFQIESLIVLACLTFAGIALYLFQGISFAKFGARMLWPLWPFVLIIGPISWHHKRYRGRWRNHPAHVDRRCAGKLGDNDNTAK